MKFNMTDHIFTECDNEEIANQIFVAARNNPLEVKGRTEGTNLYGALVKVDELDATYQLYVDAGSFEEAQERLAVLQEP